MVRVGAYEKAADAQAAAAQLTTQGFQKVHVDYTGDDGTSTGGPWQVHVLDVDPRRFKGTVAPVLATDVVPGRETVSSIDGRTDALAGINGGYFVIGDSDGTPGDLAGISMVGGDLVSEAVNGRTDLLLPHRNGRGAQVTQLSTVLSVRANDRSRRELDGRNRRPGLIRSCGGVGGDQPTERPLHDVTCTDPSELIQFTPAFGAATDPSSEIEAVLDDRGRVLAHRPPGGPIPAGGSVLAGTGDGADWLRSHAQPGHTVHVRTRVASDGWPLKGEAQLGAVNGGPRLLRGGTPAIDAASEGFTHPDDPEFFYRFGIRRNPRTLAGITRSGHLLLVALEPLSPEHEEGLFAVRQGPGVWRYLTAFPDAAETRERFHLWMEQALAESAAGREGAFAILDRRRGAPIGSTRYLALGPAHRGLEIGWTWLGRAWWRTGANVECKLLLLGRAFREARVRAGRAEDRRGQRALAGRDGGPSRPVRGHPSPAHEDRQRLARHGLVQRDRTRVADRSRRSESAAGTPWRRRLLRALTPSGPALTRRGFAIDA